MISRLPSSRHLSIYIHIHIHIHIHPTDPFPAYPMYHVSISMFTKLPSSLYYLLSFYCLLQLNLSFIYLFLSFSLSLFPPVSTYSHHTTPSYLCHFLPSITLKGYNIQRLSPYWKPRHLRQGKPVLNSPDTHFYAHPPVVYDK